MTGCLESSDCLLPPAPASFPCRLPPCFSVCLRRKRCRDGLFEVGGCVLVVADEVCDETALAVEDEGLRDAVVGGEEELDGLVVGVCELILDAVLLDEVGNLRAVVLAADVEADDLEALRAEAALELDEVRNLLAAGRAVGRPEVEHDDLAAVVFERGAPTV